MRAAAHVLVVAGLVWSVAACTSGGDPGAAPGASPSPVTPSGTGTPAGVPAVPPSAAPAPASTTRAPAPTPPRRSPPASTPPPPPPPPATTAGDVPGPLPWGERTLTGTVDRSGDCVLLLVGTRRWAITGQPVVALRTGARVTVYGALTPRPAACAGLDLAQSVAVTRVEAA